MKVKALPTQARLQELFDYSKRTGLMKRKIKVCHQPAGKVVGSPSASGHLSVCVDGTPYWVHRLAWCWVTGEDPGHLEVDHRDGDPSNNKWENLRKGTHQRNLVNQKLNKSNTSGYPGVRRCNNSTTWFADIRHKGKTYYLGTFQTPEEAWEVRQAKALELRGEWDRPIDCQPTPVEQLTSEQIDHIKHLRSQGYTWREIAQKTQLPPAAVRQNLVEPRKLVSEEEVEVFRSMREQGHTYQSIGDATGWAESVVRRHLKKAS